MGDEQEQSQQNSSSTYLALGTSQQQENEFTPQKIPEESMGEKFVTQWIKISS